MIWWLYTTPSDTLDVLFDEAIDSLIETLDLACQRAESGKGPFPVAERGWQGSRLALHVYGSLACIEMRHKRGYEDEDRFSLFGTPGKQLAADGAKFEMPPWYEDEDLIKSHWSAGLRQKAIISDIKTPYDEVDEYWPILWPILDESGGYELHVNKREREMMACDDLWLPDEVLARVANV